MWCCFRPKETEEYNAPSKEKKEQRIPTAGGFHNDIIYYKFLNADTYELDITKMQIWVFDKRQVCVHASDNEYKADYYVGKNLANIVLREDVLDTFKDIHTLALSSIESKRTVMINNTLAYIEGRTLYYNEDINDVYGSMLVFIPYKNILPTGNRETGGSGTYVLKGNVDNTNRMNTTAKASSLDSPLDYHNKHNHEQYQEQSSRISNTSRDIMNKPHMKRTMSDSKIDNEENTVISHNPNIHIQEKDKDRDQGRDFEKKKAELISKLQDLIENK
jgi:hypothetical protein